ncbi:MAG: uroporphyrinogen-III synthase [Burkholderiales bacterium]|nr:uroporphyrinogen-III synthase [Burkholderiales bacterium]
MRVIVTRPETDAQAWLDAIEQAGHEALYVPLIAIGPAPDVLAIERAWHQWRRWQAVMFVSAQAVRMFFAHRGSHVLLGSASSSNHETAQATGPRYWATGPGTRQALIDAGVLPDDIDAPVVADAVQFDSEALWQVIAPSIKKHAPVLIVRGNDGIQNSNPQGVGRDWLAQQIVDAGASVEFVVAYLRSLPIWSDHQLGIARQAAADGSVWCFSSSQAVLHLQAQLPDVQWHRARCIATHARIAQTARDLGFVKVMQTRPLLSDMLASLESST